MDWIYLILLIKIRNPVFDNLRFKEKSRVSIDNLVKSRVAPFYSAGKGFLSPAI